MKESKYRAAVSQIGGELEIRQVDRRPLGSRDLRLKVLACGVCGSDVASVMRGEFIEEGQVLGHELALEVIEAGSAFPEDFAPGTKVAILSSRSCGTCPYCLRGQPYLCDLSRSLSVGYGIPGGFAEEMIFPDADPEHDLIILPSDIDPRDALWIEPLSVAMHAVARSGLDSDSEVLVIGAGSVGLAVSAAVLAKGIVPFIAEPREERREAARRLGAKDDDESAERRYSVVIDTSGSVAAIDVHLPRLRDRGILTLVGLGGASLAPPPRGIEMRASFAFSYEDWEDAAHAVAEGTVALGDLVNEIVPLEDAEAAVGSIATNPHIIKAAIAPNGADWVR